MQTQLILMGVRLVAAVTCHAQATIAEQTNNEEKGCAAASDQFHRPGDIGGNTGKAHTSHSVRHVENRGWHLQSSCLVQAIVHVIACHCHDILVAARHTEGRTSKTRAQAASEQTHRKGGAYPTYKRASRL